MTTEQVGAVHEALYARWQPGFGEYMQALLEGEEWTATLIEQYALIEYLERMGWSDWDVMRRLDALQAALLEATRRADDGQAAESA
ncbi:MAG: hypothetical protein IMW98_08500 [Firmicutes bacterium]|nr:hypothetical protein [Bacillota bacterium]MBE3590845.1 hypothetical protein [Bacillota bacterium]